MLFSLAYVFLYVFGLVLLFVKYSNLTTTQRNFAKIDANVPGMLFFLFSMCYNVVYWLM